MALDVMLPISWHAHEMIFGFTLAVVAGYLVSVPAIASGAKASHQMWMSVLLVCWVIARVLPFVSHPLALSVMFVFDLIFCGWLLAISVKHPVLQDRWSHWAVSMLIAMLLISNATYYSGLLGYISDGERIGLLAGFYLVLALMFLICQNAVATRRDDSSSLTHNDSSANILSVVLFPLSLTLMLVVAAVDVFLPDSPLVVLIGVVLTGMFLLNAAHRAAQGSRQDLLNWAIVVAYLFIAIGFAFKAADSINHLLPRLAIHAFAIGGVGMLATALMVSVSPRKARIKSSRFSFGVFLMFGAVSGSAVIFILAPLWLAPKYVLIVAASQLGWIVAVMLFLVIFTPALLTNKRRSKVRSNIHQ